MPPHRLLAETARYGSSAVAPPPRTLIDVLEATAARHPLAAALDDGTSRLDYATLLADVAELAERFAEAGVRRGDRVGIHIPSGTAQLYLAVLGVLAAGAAYVPVDVDDPPERAALVFGEAGVRAVIGEGLRIEVTGAASPHTATSASASVSVSASVDGAVLPHAETATASASASADGAASARPGVEDDAWIIFTSGSTGTPKGVAVTHRAAAGVRWRSNSRSRQWRISFGSGIFTGQTLSHLPQKVEALGSRPVFSMPTSDGVSTLPIGPG